MQRQRMSGKRYAIFVALALFLQSFGALHVHSEEQGPAPGFHNCAICAADAFADDDSYVPPGDPAVASSVSQACKPGHPSQASLLFARRNYAQAPRAPPV